MSKNMNKYEYIPEHIYRIYVGILKRKYEARSYASLLSRGSYIIGLSYPGVNKYKEGNYALHPISDGFVRF